MTTTHIGFLVEPKDIEELLMETCDVVFTTENEISATDKRDYLHVYHPEPQRDWPGNEPVAELVIYHPENHKSTPLILSTIERWYHPEYVMHQE
jgi:hypothetical protein